MHAVLNFNQQTTTTSGLEIGKNGKPISTPTSQDTTHETYTGNGAQAAGTSAPPPSTTNGNGTYNSTQTQTQTAVGQVSETVQQAPGQVIKTAVAVLVNSSSVKPAQLSSIKSLVLTAAGLDLTTGDSIVVTALPFSPAAQPAAAKPPTMMSKLTGFAPDVGLLLLILLLFFMAMRSSKKRRPVFEEIPMRQFGGALSPIDMDTGELPAVSLGPRCFPKRDRRSRARSTPTSTPSPGRGRAADAVLVPGAVDKTGVVTR